VGAGPLSGDDRRAQRQLAAQGSGGDDLGELAHFAGAVAAEQLKAFAEQLLRGGAHDLADQFRRGRGLRRDPLTASVQDVHLRALLVGGQVGLQAELAHARAVRHDPPACPRRRLTGHVLSRGVPGGVAEPEEDKPAGRELLDVARAASAGCRVRLPLDVTEAGRHPLPERPGLSRAVEAERRRPLHPVVHHGGRDAARGMQQLHAPVVAGDQRPFGRRQRHVELPRRVLAVHQQRPGDPDRQLGGADEVLHVPGNHGRVQRVAADIRRTGTRGRAGEVAALRRGFPAVVVRKARDRAAFARHHVISLARPPCPGHRRWS
jgi:hypothetical protein